MSCDLYIRSHRKEKEAVGMRVLFLVVSALFLMGIAIGSGLHVLDTIKYILMENPQASVWSPLYGVRLTLDQLWDITIIFLFLYFTASCFLASYIGLLVHSLKGKEPKK